MLNASALCNSDSTDNHTVVSRAFYRSLQSPLTKPFPHAQPRPLMHVSRPQLHTPTRSHPSTDQLAADRMPRILFQSRHQCQKARDGEMGKHCRLHGVFHHDTFETRSSLWALSGGKRPSFRVGRRLESIRRWGRGPRGRRPVGRRLGFRFRSIQYATLGIVPSRRRRGRPGSGCHM